MVEESQLASKESGNKSSSSRMMPCHIAALPPYHHLLCNGSALYLKVGKVEDTKKDGLLLPQKKITISSTFSNPNYVTDRECH